ncbi:MAG: trypsin-like peptidase domain-containing protein [Desulfobacula sp.]|nr:trypsin-like peptidase domain-containing protein [Desulfobacula sp.]
MKKCPSCGQILSEKISLCPACGGHPAEGLKYIDDYKILDIIHEGYSSLVAKAVKDDESAPVTIRLFTDASGVDDTVAQRLLDELEALKKLPPDHFVAHYAVKKSNDGHWYRVSEWVEAEDWGSIFMSGRFHDQRSLVKLFYNIASALDLLHKYDHFMPYLVLEDILIPAGGKDDLNVKINYKLSRFLNARATHHGPMLEKLLECHPDIIHKRAIDFRSSIWSLGKVFLEIMTQDPDLKEFSLKAAESRGIEPELAVLIKVMLADDPDLRPQTMGKIVFALARILDRLPYSDARPLVQRKKHRIINDLKWMKKVIFLLIFIIIAMIAAAGVSWIYLKSETRQAETVLSEFVESHAGSVAFVLVEYRLSEQGRVIFRNKVEGTAFLVDKAGYLITNRHVACPWLDDGSLFKAYDHYSQYTKNITFDFRMFLWFEGARAFNRLPAFQDSPELNDLYDLSSAYSTGGPGNLRIAGVPRTLAGPSEMIRSPFLNDFAVLKIDNPPPGLRPLPLETRLKAEDIKRLSPVVILGFPLGNQTQYDRINTSITRGHVRRTSRDIIQVDSSIYKGNSGGPAVSSNGRVIGIASGVVTDQNSGNFTGSTPLSDFGLILPISRPAKFIDLIKAGQPQWDGVLDFSLPSKLEEITNLALENEFKKAEELSETMLKTSNDPILLFASAMLKFCTTDFDQSASYFKRLCSMEPENHTSRLMLYIMAWLSGKDQPDALTRNLFDMDWYDADEYLGYLARVLKDKKRMEKGLIDYENLSEKSWRLFMEGLISEKANEVDHAREVFEQSILTSDINDWVYFLSFSRLNRIRENSGKGGKEKKARQKDMDAFIQRAKEYRKEAAGIKETIAALIDQFESGTPSHEENVEILEKLMALSPENLTLLGKAAFYHAGKGNRREVVDLVERYFDWSSRETGLGLSLGLLKGEILALAGERQAAVEYLNSFYKSIRDPFYRAVIKHLLENTGEDLLTRLAEKKPEKLVTLHTALGLWAEGEKHPERAAHHYREALGTYLDNWNEYSLSLGRLAELRKARN